MHRIARIIVLPLVCALWACSSTSEDPTSALTPARDLTGRWIGTGPNGASFQDNVANPNCRYDADLVLDFAQDGNSVAGTLTLTVRETEGPLAEPTLPCLPVGTVNQQAFTGEVGSTRVNFTLADGITVFSGTFTSNLMSGEFVVNAANGVIGDWSVIR